VEEVVRLLLHRVLLLDLRLRPRQLPQLLRLDLPQLRLRRLEHVVHLAFLRPLHVQVLLDIFAAQRLSLEVFALQQPLLLFIAILQLFLFFIYTRE